MSRNGFNNDHDDLIQRYLDDELGKEKKIEVKKLLAENPALRRRLDEYRQMSVLISEAVNMEEIEGILDTRFSTILSSARETGEVSFWDNFKVGMEEFFIHRKRVWVPAAATVVVAISTLAFVLGLTGKAPEPEPERTKEKWSRVTSVSLGANSSMILEMEGDSGTRATVLWVLEGPEGMGMEPEEETRDEPSTEDAQTDD